MQSLFSKKTRNFGFSLWSSLFSSHLFSSRLPSYFFLCASFVACFGAPYDFSIAYGLSYRDGERYDIRTDLSGDSPESWPTAHRQYASRQFPQPQHAHSRYSQYSQPLYAASQHALSEFESSPHVVSNRYADVAPNQFDGIAHLQACQHGPHTSCPHCVVNTIRPGFPNYDRWSSMNAMPWTWQVMPDGLIFPSYLAGPKESRLSALWNYERNHGWMWDAVAGGRIGLVRYGSEHGVLPEGFQLDAEGAAMVRLDIEQELDVMAADFRVGFPLTYGTKTTQYKLAYYHVSSHLGDEYMLRPNARERVNYVRDAIVLAVSHRPHRDMRIYAEAAWAFFTGDRTEPWEFQFGFEYSPIYPAHSYYGAPFFAIHGHLLEELDFGGNLNVQLGWQWRGPGNNLFRLGVQYFNGASDQFEFQDVYESKIGFGVWADF